MDLGKVRPEPTSAIAHITTIRRGERRIPGPETSAMRFKDVTDD